MSNILVKNDDTDSSSNDGPQIGKFFITDDRQKADARLEELLTILEAKDRDALENMFSKQALEEIEDLEGEVDYLLSFFEGEVNAWERDAFTSGNTIKDGKKSIAARVWYIVETDKDTYIFFMIDYIENTINPDMEGLYTLRVIKAEDEDTEFTYWQDMEIAGIYVPEEQ